jgi:hypothetical protein
MLSAQHRASIEERLKTARAFAAGQSRRGG